jgi:hypothetical protein
MTSTFRKALIAITALTLAATSLSAPSFAKDGDLKRGKFQIVVPKSDRVGGSGQIATTQFVAPKAKKAGGSGQVFTSQFVPPKADRDNGGSGLVLFRLTPKSPLAGSGPSGNSVTTAKFVAPKATREDAPVVASVEAPKPLLLAPATVSLPVAEAPAETSATDAGPESAPIIAATSGQVTLAYLRAAQRYGYGGYSPASYEADGDADDNSAYAGEDYGDDNCD